jgi:hypothetical protein
VDGTTKKRILPVFYSDNFVSVLPGEEQAVSIDLGPAIDTCDAQVSICGWNAALRYVGIHWQNKKDNLAVGLLNPSLKPPIASYCPRELRDSDRACCRAHAMTFAGGRCASSSRDMNLMYGST